MRRLKLHQIPKHVSWLNMVESNIGVLRGHCLDGRISERERLSREVAAWQEQRNATGVRINWKFTTKGA